MRALTLVIAIVSPALAAAQDLADLGERYRSAEAADARIDALEKIAALQPPVADAAAVTQALVAGLQDADFVVRARAVELVAEAPDQEVALDALLAACIAQAGQEQEVQERVRGTKFEPLGTPRRKQRDPAKAKADALEKIEDLLAAATELQEYLESKKDLVLVREALAAKLPGLRDDRSVAGLGALLEVSSPWPKTDPVVDGLLTLGGPEALNHLAGVFERNDELMKARKKRYAELKREKPGPKPNGFWADEVWENKERERIAKALTAFEEASDAMEAWVATVVERVARYAEDQGLPDPPRKALPGRAWRYWAKKAGKDLPGPGRG